MESIDKDQYANKEYLSAAVLAFETDMAEQEIYFTDIQILKIHEIDFNRDTQTETIILFEGTIDQNKSIYIQSLDLKEDCARFYKGLYFISSGGDVSQIASCVDMSLGYLYISQ